MPLTYADPVAIILDGAIRFGTVLEVRTITDKSGKRAEYLVQPTMFKSDLPYGEPIVLSDDAVRPITAYSNGADELIVDHGLIAAVTDASNKLLNPIVDAAPAASLPPS